MGPVMTPEQHKAVSEKIAERKAAVAASLGKTLEEFERDQRAMAAGGAADHDHAAAEKPAAGEAAAEDDCGVDEEAVLTYIRTRQQTIDDLRRRVRTLEAQVKHVESQRDLAEKKCAALRDALAKVREQAKQQTGAAGGQPAE